MILKILGDFMASVEGFNAVGLELNSASAPIAFVRLSLDEISLFHTGESACDCAGIASHQIG